MNAVLRELASKEFWICVVSEFLGSLFYLYIASGAGVAMNPNSPPSVIQMAFATGLTIATIVMALWHTSGGLVNPALTVAFVVGRKISVVRGLVFIFVQVVGAITGSAVLYGCVPAAKRGTLGACMRASDVTTGQALACEIMLTFFLVLVVFACVDPKRDHFGYEPSLAIGVCVAVCLIMGIPISGAAINPARAIGPAVVANVWLDHWIYWFGPIFGAVAATVSYRLVFRATQDRRPQKQRFMLETRGLGDGEHLANDPEI